MEQSQHRGAVSCTDTDEGLWRPVALPSAAAAPVLLRPGHLLAPLDPLALFGRSAPLALEIGFGNGAFLLAQHRRLPAWNFLGADISAASHVRARARLRGGGAQHVALFAGDARFLVREGLPQRALARVHVNFPDPWPKGRHAGNRLLDARFLALLEPRLADGGELLLTTDHAEYFEQALAAAAASGRFRAQAGTPPPETLETKYAQRWRADQKEIHHARFTLARRVAEEPATPRPRSPSLVERDMHHATLSGELPSPDSFAKSVRRFAGGTAIVLEVLHDARGRGLTFLVRVEEEDLVQELLVDARVKRGSRVFVGVRSFGAPLPTRGAREAVAEIAGWLEAQGLELVERSF